MTRVFLLAVLFLLSGCATQERRESQAALEREFRETVPVCIEGADCDQMWSAARRWVLDNAGFRIQHYGDDYIETYNNRYNAETATWARVTKEPMGSGQSRILVELGCNNWFGCGLSPLADAKVRFNRHVQAAASQ